ncbi:TraB/GumN family protein [Parendozoicomonas haliclonae]|uniref:TraB family protein n=1 Tax=Parendozoicomonas haliclonae TaxID=1960125 RepID=A0A1X7AMH0_9GAMM|nr:TraB/GumN family protein [Parendozoicomonas haliclonae]SMA49214.1 TraB family protein [Parendozoicomonas haliclonae]
MPKTPKAAASTVNISPYRLRSSSRFDQNGRCTTRSGLRTVKALSAPSRLPGTTPGYLPRRTPKALKKRAAQYREALQHLAAKNHKHLTRVKRLQDQRPLWKARRSGCKSVIHLYGSIHSTDLKTFPVPKKVMEQARRSTAVAMEIAGKDYDALFKGKKHGSHRTPKAAGLHGYQQLSEDNKALYHAFCESTGCSHTFCSHTGSMVEFSNQLQDIWLKHFDLETSSMEKAFSDYCQSPYGPALISLETNASSQAILQQILDRIHSSTASLNQAMNNLGQILNGATESQIFNKIPIHAGDFGDAFQCAARNKVMTDKIADYIENNPDASLFVLTGAAHYPGPSGLLARLKRKGWNISTSYPGMITKSQ